MADLRILVVEQAAQPGPHVSCRLGLAREHDEGRGTPVGIGIVEPADGPSGIVFAGRKYKLDRQGVLLVAAAG